ncbi:MAG: wzc [Parachlamydiales bacterium]|nr:wzc [Parachlamydiales bacterium]
MTPLNPEEKIFSLQDLSRLFRAQKKRLLRAGSLCALMAMLYVFSKPAVYQIDATFKEGAEKKEAESVLKDFITNMGSGLDAPQAASFMKSYQVIHPLVSRMGLQVQVIECGWLRRKWNRLRDVVYSEMGCTLADLDRFRFSNVSYDGEKPLDLQLTFLDRDRFEIQQGSQKIQGRVNDSTEIGGASFCLWHAPAQVKIGSPYPMRVASWIDTAKSIRNSLKIATNKLNKSILELSLSMRDRHLGADILNEMMSEYQRYLKRDHDQLAHEQLAYLEERQNDLVAKLGRAMDEHVSYLRSNVGSSGFLSVDQETQAFLKPYQELFTRSFVADLEMEHLSACRDHPTSLAVGETSPIGVTIQRLRQEIQSLEGQRDLLGAALFFHPAAHEEGDDVSELPHDQQLHLVRMDLQAAKNALNDIETDGGLPLQLELFHDPNHVVQSWAQRIEEHGEEKNDLAQYLHNMVRLFSVREKILLERQFQPQNDNTELNGIDLNTAKKLLIQTSQKLDESKASVQRYRHLLNRIDDPAFELASLCAVLRDPTSQQILGQASKLHLEMEDESSHSEKEASRNRRENALQRKILSDHLKQMIVVEQLNRSIFQDKIASLQQVALDCVNRLVCIDQEQIAALALQRRESLKREKEILVKKMHDLRACMNELPEKWRAESLLKLRTEMGVRIMQSVAQLVESKTIGQHLHHVESKPLDPALCPLLPQRPQLLLLGLAGAIIGALAAFIWTFLQSLYRGFPVGADTLRALCYPYAGPISFHADGPNIDHLPDPDLESLRKILLKIDEAPQAKILGILAGGGPDYSHSLAHLLAQSGRKVLLVRCDFTAPFSESDTPGLRQVVSGSAAIDPIRSFASYDVMPSGGYTRFGAELLRSLAVPRMLEGLSLAYDHILLFSRAPLDSAESASMLRLSQTAIVTISAEPIELLTPFVQWAYHEGQSRLTFLTTSCSS